MKSALPEISTSMVHALKFGGQAIQRLGQHRSAADREPLRDHDAFCSRIKSLERRMQQQGAAFVFREAAVIRHQQEIRLQADDGFERGKAAGLEPEIGGGIGQDRHWPATNWSGCRRR